jgi:hypothetical protein
MKPRIKPTPKQHEAWEALKDDEHKFIVFGGGAGGGKSWLGCEWLLTNCYFYPGSKWFIGREELKRLMSSSYVTWNKVVKHHNIPSTDWKYNGQYNFIEIKNGSRIDLLDLKYLPGDPLYERFGSLEYTGGWIEEAGEVDFRAFDVLKSRVGRHQNREHGLLPKMFLTCNPNKKWLYSKVYRPHKEGGLSPDYIFIQSLYKDNPYTAEEYGEQLDQIEDYATKQRLKFGNWEYDSDEGALVKYESILEMFRNQAPKSIFRCLTIDVARHGKDKAVIMYWEGWQAKEMWVYPPCSIDELERNAVEIINKKKLARSDVIADEDGVGGGLVDFLKCRGFVANHSPIYDQNEKLNYQNLKAQCGHLLAQKINSKSIGFDPTKWEPDIIEETEQLKRVDLEKEGKFKLMAKDEIKENIGRSPDFLDNMIMRAWFEVNKYIGTGETYDYNKIMKEIL